MIQFVDELPDAELQWIEECGHVPHLEQPEETASAILKFLTSEKVVAATASAARAKGSNGASGNGENRNNDGLDFQPLVVGGGFLGFVSGAFLLEEAIRNLIGF